MNSRLLFEWVMWYPFILWWGFFLLFRFRPVFTRRRPGGGSSRPFLTFENRLRSIPGRWALLCLGVSLVWRVPFGLGYRYESQIFMEAAVPFLFALPLFKKYLRSFSCALLALFPLLVLVCVEQIKCVQFGQWQYSLEGNRYFLWAREEGTIVERSFWFGGPDFPVIELGFYLSYIFMTGAVVFIALEALPAGWRKPEPALKWFFPAVYGAPLMLMAVFLVWFVSIRRDTFPFHALAAFMSLFLMWAGFLSCEAVRKWCSTRMFAAGAVFSFLNTGMFEWYHCSLQRHWVYIPENEIASLHPWLHIRFPDLPGLGGLPISWPVEEFCAYPTLYVFVFLYLVYFHSKLGVPIFNEAFPGFPEQNACRPDAGIPEPVHARPMGGRPMPSLKEGKNQ